MCSAFRMAYLYCTWYWDGIFYIFYQQSSAKSQESLLHFLGYIVCQLEKVRQRRWWRWWQISAVAGIKPCEFILWATFCRKVQILHHSPPQHPPPPPPILFKWDTISPGQHGFQLSATSVARLPLGDGLDISIELHRLAKALLQILSPSSKHSMTANTSHDSYIYLFYRGIGKIHDTTIQIITAMILLASRTWFGIFLHQLFIP